MAVPPSRVSLAVPEYEACPHCTIAGPTTDWANSSFPDGMTSAGGDPCTGWASTPYCNPGTAPAAQAVMNSGTPYGVCGTQQKNGGHPSYFLDYNRPFEGVYGESVVATYEPGEVIDVEWCVNADHGGVYSWRLCRNETIVGWFLGEPGGGGGETPLTVEMAIEAEECFQRGTLRCDDVATNDCTIGPYCLDGMPCRDDPGRFFHCSNPEFAGTYATNLPAAGGYCSAGPAGSCPLGSGIGEVVRDQVRIPEDFPPTDRTLLSYRWDSFQTREVFMNCADIQIGYHDSGGQTADGEGADGEAASTVSHNTFEHEEATCGNGNVGNGVCAPPCCRWGWCDSDGCSEAQLAASVPEPGVEGTCGGGGEGNGRCNPRCCSAAGWCHESFCGDPEPDVQEGEQDQTPCGDGERGNGECPRLCCNDWGWYNEDCTTQMDPPDGVEPTCGGGSFGNGYCAQQCCSPWGWCHEDYC